MRMSFGANAIINAIRESQNIGDISIARSLFCKNKRIIEAEDPDLYKKLEAELYRKSNIAQKRAISDRIVKKAEPKQTKQVSKRGGENRYYSELLRHLKAGRPIPAYRIYKDKKPLSKDNFLKLCEDIMSSGILRETMNYTHATAALARIIKTLKNNLEDENIFEGVVSGVSDKNRAARKSVEIYHISKQYPGILFGKLATSTERQHVAWFGDYSKYKGTMLQQELVDASADLLDLDDDIHYMDREQRLEAIADRYQISRRTGYIQKSIENVKLIADNPYFARIDFKDHKRNDENKIVYISKIKNIEDYPAQQKNISYADWRAPIGDLFYRTNDSLGEAPFMDGYVDVILNGRIIIRKGELIRLDANSKESVSSSNSSDDILQERLAQSSEAKLGEVVETIQVEQNEIIRHTAGKDLVIQGSAGSGKTIIGVHRIAYLMYSKSLKNNSILFVSPNDDFSKYVSDVLPELGEYNMPIVTMNDIINAIFTNLSLEYPATKKGIEEFIDHYFNDEYNHYAAPIEEFSSFIEHYFENGYDRNVEAKYSYDYNENFIKTIDDLHFNKISLSLDSVMNAEANLAEVKSRKNIISEICASRLQVGGLSDYRKYENSALVAALWAKANNVILKLKPSKDGMYTLCCEDDPSRVIAAKARYDALMKNVRNQAKKHAEYKEGEIVFRYSDEAVDKEIETHRYQLIKQSFNNQEGSKNSKDYYHTKEHSDVIHVVVDEAQDYSPLHIQLLRMVFPRAHFTILGDENQNLNPYCKNSHLMDLLPGADYIGVRKAYRSSPEIVNYTNKILNEDILAVRKSNNIPVTEITVNNYREISDDSLLNSIKSINNNWLKRVAVICRDEKLKQYFSNKMNKFRKYGVSMGFYTVYEAKGLEFDAAIVIDTYSDYENELLYTACTRAQHQLIVYREDRGLLGKILRPFRR